MYTDTSYVAPSCAPLQALVEPLFRRHAVDVALWGHHHSYQRSCSMTRGQCVGNHADAAAGVVHTVIGAAGYEFSPIAEGADIPNWVEYADNATYGFGMIDATKSTFHFQFVRSDGRGVLDEFTLHKR